MATGKYRNYFDRAFQVTRNVHIKFWALKMTCRVQYSVRPIMKEIQVKVCLASSTQKAVSANHLIICPNLEPPLLITLSYTTVL
jgi:hypothetical protein